MDNFELKVDISHWNLDGLDLLGTPKQSGEVRVIALNPDSGIVGRVLTIRNMILILRPAKRVVERIDPETNSSTKHHDWREEEFLDMTVCGDNLFSLVSNRDGQQIRQYRVIPDRILKEMSWNLLCAPATSDTKIAVSYLPGRNSPVAIVGPLEDQTIVSLVLETDPPACEQLNVVLDDSPISLGPEFDFCIDPRSQTLIVADTLNHRIVEINVNNGRGRVICGVGKSGNSMQHDEPTSALLNSPKAIQIYRPDELVRTGLLNEPSRNVLLHDPQRIKPRTIIIADSGNCSIKKLVEFPLTAALTEGLPRNPIMYTFLGSGEEQLGVILKPNLKAAKDLRTYAIPRPTAIAVSALGELVVTGKSATSLLLLQPATARIDKVILEKASRRGFDRS